MPATSSDLPKDEEKDPLEYIKNPVVAEFMGFKRDTKYSETELEQALVDNLGTVLAFVDGQLEEHGCPMRTQYEIDVAVEELFVNVASYAYETGVGAVTVEMEVEENPKTAVIRFTDRGIPYNPAAREDPDVTLPADQREIGGLGIFMVKKSMDQLAYEYKDGQNIVTIRKTIK